MTKQELYSTLSTDLAPFWHRDIAMLERNPEKWALAWEVDAWLIRYRADPAVGIEQYTRVCQKLRDIYAVGARGAEPSVTWPMPCPEAEAPQTPILDDSEVL